MRKILTKNHNKNFIRICPKKNIVFEDCTLFKFNNFGLPPGMTLRFYTSMAKGLTLKVKKFVRLGSTFVEVTGKNWLGVIFGSFLSHLE